MRAAWSILACALALALGGCGGPQISASPTDRARVRELLPRARDISCTRSAKGVTRCEVSVRKRPVGSEDWHCEFKGDVHLSGSSSCWTENGSADSLAVKP